MPDYTESSKFTLQTIPTALVSMLQATQWPEAEQTEESIRAVLKLIAPEEEVQTEKSLLQVAYLRPQGCATRPRSRVTLEAPLPAAILR